MFYALSLLCFIVRPSISRMHSLENSRYECGLHGKFEYCIDGIPGCVIGCHCHPGYYFDTHTKICEPNTKLTDHFRQHYIAEPTRVYEINTPTTTALPTPTAKNGVDPFEKDTDELGDWLYNQFFKTVEAQVMNKTSDKTPTRRKGEDSSQTGGGGLGSIRPTRKFNNFNTKKKTHKSMKTKGKKRKFKGNGLRRKLLRITEDDSLFDSDSDSDESDNESSSDDDDSSSSSSSSGTSKERLKNSTDEREHGHKKVVIFNRRPRPPLPSFIILPSMDTPYYPPLGLPPPPVMPMYPMVPIPPMAPCLPFLDKNTVTSTTATTNTTPKTISSTFANTERPTESTTMPTDGSNDPDTDLLRNKNERHTKSKSSRKMRREETIIVPSGNAETENQITSQDVERFKLLKQLRSKLRIKHRTSPVPDSVIDELDENLIMNDISTEQALPANNMNPHRNKNERDAKLKDFKYLSELIHKVNFNDTERPTNKLNDFNEKLKFLEKIPNIRRNYNPQTTKGLYGETTTHKPLQDQDSESTYFMNLGRQIASLVRTGNPKFNDSDYIPKNQNNEANSMLSVLKEDRYPSRSYWERSVRSPLKKLTSYFPGFNFYNENNNENNLYNLENAFKNVASTVHPMSLHELENILRTLNKRQAEIRNNYTSQELLLPKKIKKETSDTIFPEQLSHTQYTIQRRNLQNLDAITEDSERTNTTHYLDSTNFDLPMVDGWMLQNQDIPMRFIKQKIINLQPLSLKNASSNNIYTSHLSKPNKEFLPIDRYSSQNTNISSDENLLPINKLLDLQSIPQHQYDKHDEIDKPKNHYGLHVKYPESDKYSELQEKDVVTTANKPGVASANSEPHAKYQKLPDNYNLIKKKLQLPAKHRQLLIQPYSLLSEFKSFILPAKQDFYTNHLKNPIPISVKYHNMQTKYNNLPGKHMELHKTTHDNHNKSTNLPDTSVKYAEKQYSELPVNFTEQSRRHYDLTRNYSFDSTIHNNKILNIASDVGGKRQYTFEASNPLFKPSYRKTFSKRVNSPSYFHHELHHFDYFE